MAIHRFDGSTPGPGRPKGSQTKKTKIENLLTAKVIDNTFKEDFVKGVPFVRQLAYEHFFGKPENTNKNIDIKYPAYIKMITGPEIPETKEKEVDNGQSSDRSVIDCDTKRD